MSKHILWSFDPFSWNMTNGMIIVCYSKLMCWWADVPRKQTLCTLSLAKCLLCLQSLNAHLKIAEARFLPSANPKKQKTEVFWSLLKVWVFRTHALFLLLLIKLPIMIFFIDNKCFSYLWSLAGVHTSFGFLNYESIYTYTNTYIH